jgi:ABC-type multidrug transport system fused ATPase/permease subunit
VATLCVGSTVSGLSEAGILAITAQVATALVDRRTSSVYALGPLPVHLSVGGLLLVALGLALVRLTMQAITSVVPAVIAGDVQADMRGRLLGSYVHADWGVQAQDREGHFQELMTNQIAVASQGALQATQLVVTSFALVVLVASAFALDAVAAVAVFGAAIVLFVVLRPLGTAGSRMSAQLSRAQLDFAGSVGEANRLSEEAQVFGVRLRQIAHVTGYTQAARRHFVRAQSTGRLVPNVYQSAIYIVLVVGLIVLDNSHAGHFSSLGAVVLVLVRAGSYGSQSQSYYQFLLQSLPYIERITDTTGLYSEAAVRVGGAPLARIDELAFEGVEYAYREGRPVLRQVTFTVEGSESIGVIGPSGAGKSTLVQLLLRLRAPTRGAFLVNGEQAGSYAMEDWNRLVSYVPQQPRLIHASVADNVRFYRELDDGAIERACRLARIHDDIVDWPRGYATIVGPRADAVSGGQQQRICLARAIAARPSLLVLDEPTSALDPRSEALIQESLTALRDDMILFVVAHRMSTLSICDRVMVLLDGEIDAFDTLEALGETNTYYRGAAPAAGVRSERPR